MEPRISAAPAGSAPARDPLPNPTGGLAPAAPAARGRPMMVDGELVLPEQAPAPHRDPVTPPAPDEPPRPAAARSEELQEIVGELPGGLVRWGITGIFFVLSLVVALSFVVRYPQSVTGQAVLTTARPPLRVTAASSGEVSRMLVRDGQAVAPGASLAVLRSPADAGDVERLGRLLDRFEPALRSGDSGGGEWPAVLALGDVQPAYAAFLVALSQHRASRTDPYFAAKASTLEAQIAEHQEQRRALQEGVELTRGEMAVSERALERSREMQRRGLLAVSDVEKAEAELLQKRQGISDRRNALVSSSIQAAGYQGALLDLQRERRDRELHLRLALASAFDAVRAALRGWEEKYVLKAPVGGHVSFIRPLSEGQFVAASEPVLAVVPQGPPTTATVMLANSGAGRVRTGQRVVLRLDAYPAAEFGALEGRVRQVSLVADRERVDGDREPRYMVGVDFSQGLVTTQGRRLAPRQELQGTADVVTDELRVIDRLLHHFRSLRTRSADPSEKRGAR